MTQTYIFANTFHTEESAKEFLSKLRDQGKYVVIGVTAPLANVTPEWIWAVVNPDELAR